jgi:hypothetical protein
MGIASAISGAAQVAQAAAQAQETMAENQALSNIQQQVSRQTAALKMQNDMVEATCEFVKDVGTNAKSLAHG